MKKVLLSTVGLIALGMTAPALAADMAVKAPPPAPLPVIYNWSGFYIGPMVAGVRAATVWISLGLALTSLTAAASGPEAW